MSQPKVQMRNWRRRSRMSTEPSSTWPAAALSLLMGAMLTVAGVLSGCGNRVTEPPAVGGPPLVRRLTESQYRATVADVFGSDVPITARFERGLREEGLLAIGTSEAGISAYSIEQYDAGAHSVAAAVLDEKNRAATVPCKTAANGPFEGACAQHFIERDGEALFRRPLAPEEISRFAALVRSGQERLGDFYSGLQFALAGMLVSPEFLLRIERAQQDRHSN